MVTELHSYGLGLKLWDPQLSLRVPEQEKWPALKRPEGSNPHSGLGAQILEGRN